MEEKLYLQTRGYNTGNGRPQKEEGQNIITTVDGLQYPEGESSRVVRHRMGDVGGKRLLRAQWLSTEALSVFHEFAMKKNLLYTIQGGTLIGHYWNRKIIPWDDDIDIHADEQCQQDLVLMWEKGEPITRDFYPKKTFRRGKGRYPETARKVYFLDRPCILCFAGGSKTPEGRKPIKGSRQKMLQINWKLAPLNEHEELYTFERTWKYDKGKQIPVHLWCGMDINIPQEYGGKMFDSWFQHKEVPWFRKVENEEDFPIETFNNIQTRAAIRSRGEPWLDKMYGSFWREGKHQLLKTEKDKCVDLRFRNRKKPK